MNLYIVTSYCILISRHDHVLDLISIAYITHSQILRFQDWQQHFSTQFPLYISVTLQQCLSIYSYTCIVSHTVVTKLSICEIRSTSTVPATSLIISSSSWLSLVYTFFGPLLNILLTSFGKVWGWDVTPCSLVEVYQYFWGSCYMLHQCKQAHNAEINVVDTWQQQDRAVLWPKKRRKGC